LGNGVDVDAGSGVGIYGNELGSPERKVGLDEGFGVVVEFDVGNTAEPE